MSAWRKKMPCTLTQGESSLTTHLGLFHSIPYHQTNWKSNERMGGMEREEQFSKFCQSTQLSGNCTLNVSSAQSTGNKVSVKQKSSSSSLSEQNGELKKIGELDWNGASHFILPKWSKWRLSMQSEGEKRSNKNSRLVRRPMVGGSEPEIRQDSIELLCEERQGSTQWLIIQECELDKWANFRWDWTSQLILCQFTGKVRKPSETFAQENQISQDTNGGWNSAIELVVVETPVNKNEGRKWGKRNRYLRSARVLMAGEMVPIIELSTIDLENEKVKEGRRIGKLCRRVEGEIRRVTEALEWKSDGAQSR